MANLDFFDRLGKETMYLWNNEDDAFVKIVPGTGIFIKFPGKEEFDPGLGSDIVNRAIMGAKEVTKQQYESGRL